MGPAALPLILERVARSEGLWFHALHAITGANPVEDAIRGNVPAMEAAWLEWAQREGVTG